MKPVLASLASVIGGEAIIRLANFATVLFIARQYGGTTLGAYAVTLSVVTVVVMFSDNGLQTAVITKLTVATSGRDQLLGQLALSKVILLAAAAICLAVIAICSRKNELFWIIGLWVSARAILQSYSQFQMAILKSIAKARWIGIIQSFHSAVLFLGLWWSFTQRWTVFVLLAWLTFGQLLELSLGVAILSRSGVRVRWSETFPFLAILKMAAPFGIAYGLANLIIRVDTIVLSMFAPLSEIGIFSAADTILLLVYVSSWLFGSLLLPEMVRVSDRPQEWKAYTLQWVRRVVLITVPAALVVSLAAPRLIVLLYGQAFAGSGMLASLLSLACPLIVLNSVYTTQVIAANRQSVLLAMFGATAVAALALDFALAHACGATGIAVAIVIREALMLVGFWLLTSEQALPNANVEKKFLQPALESNQPGQAELCRRT
jgi:polysaccharide transporter, PST family